MVAWSSGIGGGWKWRAMVAMGAIATTLLLAGAAPALALSYSAKPISATVIDADTKQPLSGVNVLIEWTLQNSNASSESFWVVDEAVTDAQGRFTLSGWGPQLVPQRLTELPRRLGPEQPTIYVFKSGYEFESASNPRDSWMIGNRQWTGDLVRSSYWDSKSIKLKKFVGSTKQYLDGLSPMADRLPLHGCRWAKVPRFTAALVMERGERINPPATSGLPTMKELESDAKKEPGCPAPAQVLAPYLK